MSRDRLYSQPISDTGPFEFDERVVEVFPDMIRRSVPGYATIVGMIELLATRHASNNSNLYDLGCSLGASTLALQKGASGKDCTVIGIDNSAAMIEKAMTLIPGNSPAVELHCADITDFNIKNASIVVMNFTLQFIDVDARLKMLQKIREGMNQDGILVLSEKIKGADKEEDDLLIELHHEFKRANDYSDLEISQKRTALENVLIPESLNTHRERLVEAGFRRVDLWFQCFNFASLIARV